MDVQSILGSKNYALVDDERTIIKISIVMNFGSYFEHKLCFESNHIECLLFNIKIRLNKFLVPIHLYTHKMNSLFI